MDYSRFYPHIFDFIDEIKEWIADSPTVTHDNMGVIFILNVLQRPF